MKSNIERSSTVRGDKEIEVMLTLRRKVDPSPLTSLADVPLAQRHHLRVSDIGKTFAPDAADVSQVRRYARSHGFRCTAVSAAGASVLLRGTVAQFNRAFGIKLVHRREPRYASPYITHDQEITIPAELKQVVTGVFGLDNRPASRRPHGLAHGMSANNITPPPVTSKSRPPAEFANLYNFPQHASGKGQSIGLLEFGGGFREKQLHSYFSSVGVKSPKLVVKEVSPGTNQPSGKPGTLNSDTEVYLDIEVAASLAPDAMIVIYFGENTTKGWLSTLQAAIFDKRHDLSVISISWGEAEQGWTPEAIKQIDNLFQLAAHRGITICCSSGDRGISENGNQLFTIAFPASSPHVLACGGTRLEVRKDGSRNEVVWNQWKQYQLASGGGVSELFPLPRYQKNAKVPLRRSDGHSAGRGIPDVAANASSDTGYLIEADDTRMSLGGTSAVAPLWAALVARLNEALGMRVGFLTPLLYRLKTNSAVAIFDITHGYNGSSRTRAYHARPGWDACTGLGSPNGEALLQWLRSFH
ncbi:MAG TPA: S53 family peptidase [Pyrinomonadaceae bacterium]